MLGQGELKLRGWDLANISLGGSNFCKAGSFIDYSWNMLFCNVLCVSKSLKFQGQL